MKRKPLKAIFHSLYFRLFITFLFTFLAIILVIGKVFKLSRVPEAQGLFIKNMHQYAEYLVTDIGSPPDVARAEKIHKEFGIEILVEYQGKFFSYPESLQKRLEDSPCGERDATEKWSRCRRFHFKKTGETTFVFSHPDLRDPDRIIPAFILGISLILLIITGSYFLVRRIFHPIKQMRRAAKEYGAGNWKARLNNTRADELGELSQTMDEMAERIERHFKSAKELQIAISHELRSPLARMKVALEFIPDEKTRKSLNEEITLLDKLTANLLEKERIESNPDALKLESVRLSEFLEGIASPFGERVKLSLITDKVLDLDSDRMTLCLRNLIENALKFSEDQVEVRLDTDDGRTRISVNDKGIGISDSELVHVGEPFFRGDSSRTGDRMKGGFGLGLSLAKSIVEAHGGVLNIKSETGKGTQVTILL